MPNGSIKINSLIENANTIGRLCPAQVIYANEHGVMLARDNQRGYLVVEVQQRGLPQFPGCVIAVWDIQTSQWVRADGVAEKLRQWVPQAQVALGLVKAEKPSLAYGGFPGDGGLTPEDFDAEAERRREWAAKVEAAKRRDERGQAMLDFALSHQGDLGRGNAAARMNGLDWIGN